ncbi:hypothetical protein ACFQU2_04445 [Siccirubricoccus deserti]
MGLATALGQELAKASAGVPLREIAAPVETRPNRVFEHEWQALGIAWQMAKSRINDRRDWAGRSEAASPRQGRGDVHPSGGGSGAKPRFLRQIKLNFGQLVKKLY